MADEGLRIVNTVDNSQFNREMSKMRESIKKSGDAVVKEGERIDAAFGKLAKSATAMFAGFEVKQFIQQVVAVRGEFQQLEVSFKTMLGSADKANALMAQITRTAAITPFDLKGVANGAKQLLAYGVQAEEVNDTLIRLGDIAAGLSLPLGDLVYLYGTTLTQGRMFTQDLRQFMGRGIPIAEELAKQFGVTKDKVQELVSTGKVGAAEFKKAIMSLSSEGGKFGGLMKEQSKTITGQISNIEDAIDNMFNDIGKQSEGIINEALSGISSLVSNYERVGRVIASVVATYGVYKAAVMTATAIQALQTAGIGAFTTVEAIHYGWLVAVEKAQKLLNKTMLNNPYVLVATLIAGVVAALISMKTQTELVKEATEKYNEEKDKAIAKEEEHKNKIDELCAIAGNEELSTVNRRKALIELVKEYPQIFEKYKTEAEWLAHLRDIKEEIAILDGKNSITNPGNELKSVNKKIAELEKKGAAPSANSYYVGQKAGRTRAEDAALEMLYKKRDELVNQIKKDKADAYIADLEKISDAALDAQIKNRRNLLAKMKLEGKKYGKVITGGAQGTFTEKEIEGQLKMFDAEKTRRNEKSFTPSQIKKQLQSDLAAARKALADFDKSSTEYTAEEAEKERQRLKQAVDDAEKKYKEAGGSISSSKGGKTAQDIAGEIAERERLLTEYRNQINEQNKDTALGIRQNNIDLLEEGYEKEKQQIDLNYDRLIAENGKRRNEMLDALKNNMVLEWQNKHPNATKEQIEKYRSSLDPTILDLTEEQRAGLKEYEKIAKDTKTKATKDLYKQLLDEYQGYEERRKSVNEKFDKERRAIEQAPVDQKAKERAIVELERQRKESIKSINNEEVEAMQKSSDLLVRLFKDSSEQSTKEIRNTVRESESLLEYLRNTSANDITPKFGFTAEQLKTILSSPDKLKAMREQIDKLKEAGRSGNPFKTLADDLANIFKKPKEGGEKESTEVKLKKLGESVSDVADMAGDAAGQLAEMFAAAGNDSAAESMETLQSVMSSVSNIGKGFAQGGLVGGISAAVGEAIGLITKAFRASAAHKAALKEILNEVTAQQRAYNLALMEQNLEFERASTILGNLDWAKAANAVNVMKNAYANLNKEIIGTEQQQYKFSKEEIKRFNDILVKFGFIKPQYSKLKEAYSGLADIEIKTGHKKTGLFGWGKGKDIYSSILDIYPQLIDAQGKFDTELAKSIINTRELKEDGKEILQNMIDLSEEAEKAWQSVHEYFTGIFGEFGKSLSNYLVDAFINGKSAAKDFTDSVSDMLETLANNMIHSLVFQDLIEVAQNEMENITKNEKLSEKDKFAKYAEVIGTLTKEALNSQDKANALMELFKSETKKNGLDIYDKDVSQQASNKGFNAMSQETGEELNGRFTALQIAAYDIKDLATIRNEMLSRMEMSQGAVKTSVDAITDAVALTNIHLSDIAKYTKHLIVIEEVLGDIKDNTKHI